MRNGVITALMGVSLAAAGCGTKNESKKDQTKAPEPAVTAQEKADLDADYAKIPAAAIVRVPVNEAGDTTGAPEMKTVQSGSSLDSADNAAAAFEGGTAPQKMVNSADELDGDSSTQSWTAYSNYSPSQSYGNSYGSGNGYDSGSTYGGDGYGSGGGYGTSQGGGYGTGQGGGYGTGQGGGYGTGQGGGYGSSSGCGSYCGGWGHDYWYNNYQPVLYYGNKTWNYGIDRPTYYYGSGYRYYCYRPNRWW